MKKLLLIITTLLLISNLSFGSHSMGHSVCYEFVSYDKNTDLHKYLVKMEFFRDMKGVTFSYPVPMTVWENTKPNYTALGSVLLDVVHIDTMVFDEILGLGCSNKTSGVTSEIFYLEGILEVPSSLFGFTLQWTSCCRNAIIDNLVPGSFSTGTKIPPTLFKNSAPCFSANPMLLVCKGIPWTFSNGAVDPDGDKLIYTLEPAYEGDNMPPLDQLVNYKTGYDGYEPFGKNSWVRVNSNTGVTTVMAMDTGTYVISVEVREYRNGFWINTVVRDMQIRVVNCGNETPAELRVNAKCGTVSKGTILLRMTEGDSLCCNLPFWDPDRDSITISYSGNLFEMQDSATLDLKYTDSLGSTMDAEFCFIAKCGTAKNKPYVGEILVHNIDGCPASTTPYKIVLFVEPKDLGSADILGPDTVCANSTATYFVNDTASSYDYKWYVSGGALMSQNNDTALIKWGNTFNTGVIQAVRIHGCYTDTLSYTVSIKPAPIARVKPLQEICIGDTVELDASLSSATGWTWSPNINISSTSSPNPKVWPASNQTYTLVVTNGICQPDTMNVQVSVHQLPNLTVSSDTSICEGDFASLLAQSGSNISFTWSPIQGLSDPNIANPLASPSDTTTYVVRAENAAGCWAEDSLTVSINSPWVDAGPLDTITLCKGDTFQSRVTAINPVSILWTPSNGLSSTAILNPKMYPTVTTQYIIEVVNADGCVDQDTITVEIVNTKLTADAGQDQDICSGDQISLQGKGGTGFTWSPASSLSAANISNPIASPATTTTYTLIVNSQSGVCEGDTASVTITVNSLPIVSAGNDDQMCKGNQVNLNGSTGFTTYSWSPAASLNNGKIYNPISKAKKTTSYILEVTDSKGCKGTDVVLITVDSVGVQALANPDHNVCGDPIDLSANVTHGSGSYSYLWVPNFALNNNSISNPVANPTSDVDYTVEVADQQTGCIGRSTITITSLNKLPLDILEEDTSLCSGQSLDIHAVGGHSSVVLDSIVWSPTFGVSNPDQLDTRITPIESGVYTLTIYYNECKTTDKIQVNVVDTPTVWIETIDSICVGSDLKLTANSFGDNNTFSYAWDNGDSGKIVSYTMLESGIASFEVTATNSFGCTSSKKAEVMIIDALEVHATGSENVTHGFMDTVHVYRGNETMIIGLIMGTYNDLLWTSSENIINPKLEEFIVNPWDDAIYTLTAWNELGCPYSDQVYVDVEPISLVKAPKVFSPNNDGYNDYFTVQSDGWEEPVLQIFNRWGQIVFTAMDLMSINQGWDGKFNGHAQPIGNYIWKFSGSSKDVNTDEKYGSFSLLR